MRHAISLQIGPARFRIGSDWETPIVQLDRLYRGYPRGDSVPDFTVRLEATSFLRRHIRPSIAIAGDFMLPDAAPLPLVQGLLAAEMAMNLQMALGWRRHLILHASAAEKDGKALIMTGLSGSGKSTLSALLGERGWRFLGDEFVLLDPQTGRLAPFPRLISLKNTSIGTMEQAVGEETGRFGPLLSGTPKGEIRHLRPRDEAIAGMEVPATPALLLFPRFGHARAVRPLEPAESFVRLTQASTNYTVLGEAGFDALTSLIGSIPVRAIDYGTGDEALELVDVLWREHAA